MIALASVQQASDATVSPSLVIAAVIALAILTAVLLVDRFIKANQVIDHAADHIAGETCRECEAVR